MPTSVKRYIKTVTTWGKNIKLPGFHFAKEQVQAEKKERKKQFAFPFVPKSHQHVQFTFQALFELASERAKELEQYNRIAIADISETVKDSVNTTFGLF